MEARPNRDWLQVLGQFGVVASLIFVGLQMKQDQEIALSAAYQARTATLIEILIATATDETTRSVMRKGQSGITDLTPDETTAAAFINSAAKELMQNSHYQYMQGFLDEEHWQSVRWQIKFQLQNPLMRDELLRGSTRPSFRLVVEELDRELAKESK